MTLNRNTNGNANVIELGQLYGMIPTSNISEPKAPRRDFVKHVLIRGMVVALGLMVGLLAIWVILYLVAALETSGM